MKSWLEKIFAATKRVFQARSARVALADGEEVYFEHDGRRLGIRNLSDSGVGLERSGRELSKGAVLEGRLFVLGKEIPVRIEVMRVAADLLGCRFVGDMRPVRAALVDLFRDEMRATEMSEVASEHLAAVGEGTPRWFYAPGNFGLFVVEKEGQVLRFDLDLAGRVFSAERGGRLRMGTIALEDRNKPSHARSQLVQWQSSVAAEDRLKVERVLANIKPLPPELAAQIRNMLKN